MSEGNVEKRRAVKFFGKINQNKIIEIVDAFDINKVRITFIEYDNSKNKGDKIAQRIDYHLPISEFELLCHNILAGCMIRKLTANENGKDEDLTIFKGSPRNGKMYSRIWKFAKAKEGIFFNVAEGPGKKDPNKGIVMPLYEFDKALAKYQFA